MTHAPESPGGTRYLPLLPVAVLAVLSLVLRVSFRSSAVFEPQYLLFILNTLFLAIIPFVVAYFAGRSYAATGSVNLLLIGCGLLLFGAGNFIAGWVMGVWGPNSTVTIHNTVSLTASICYVMAAFALAEGTRERISSRRRAKLFSSYAAVLIFVVILSVAAVSGVMPVFFAPGRGPTPLREVVLTVAVILHVLAAFFVLRLYARRRVTFLYWFGLAILLTAIGLAGVLMQPSVGSLIGWTGRVSQYLGGVYFLAAVTVMVRRARATGTPVETALASFFSESALHYRNLVETAKDAIISTDRQGRIILWNSAAETIFGFTREEAVGSRLADLTGLDESRVIPAGNGDLREHQARTEEVTLRRKDGSPLFSELSRGTAEGMMGPVSTFIIRDITERRAMESALQSKEARLRRFYESGLVGVIYWNMDGIITDANDKFLQMVGYSRNEMAEGKIDWMNMTPEEYRHLDERSVVELKATGVNEKPYEKAYIRKDGTRIPVIVAGAMLDEARFNGVAFVLDITVHKQAEDSLKTSMERLEIISDTASRLLRSDEPQRIVEALCTRVMEHLDCQAFFNFLVVEAGKRMALNAYAGIPEETAKGILSLDFGVAVCGCAARDACRIVAENIPTTPDVRTDLVRSFGIKAYACHPLMAQGRVIGTLSFGTKTRLTFTDDELSLMKTVADQVATAMERIQLLRSTEERAEELEVRVSERTTELSEAYDALRREMAERAKAEEQLRQAQKMEAIGTLAGGIAHDFNNILASVIGFTEMAIEDIPDRPEVERNLRNVLKSGMRARELVKQILTFSRKTKYERSPLSLTPIVKETVQLLRASIPRTIDIRASFHARADTVLASPVEIQQVLMNLATNASLAMPEGGTMEIGLGDIDFEPPPSDEILPGEYLQIVVKDTGTGMSPEVMKRVFEPFYTTREVGKGSGMGLAVVYGIVKDLKGTITVESEERSGSTFRVLLPKLSADAEAEAASPSEIPGGTERILFVDDEEMLAEWGETTLKRLGYQVTAMTDSTEALKAFSSNPSLFDLVVTDQAMPRMAGVQFVTEILKIRPDIPIILCTGHSDTISPEKAKELGVREFLMKPLVRQELAEAVRRALHVPASPPVS